ncbi:MAG: hypothetical protein FD157_4097 [Rhodocyclaceae bacterium]|nr:MAG: hypothetical protein FD157_4097 [Rhodocyclaceae bacterium]TNC97586.1 MAG: hypothetical protein FD118_4104 [Rhodocyclaceae bacterium]
MKISLILATVGRSADVGRFVQSLVAQTDRRFELIVVDQNTDHRLAPHIDEAVDAGIELTHVRLERPSSSGARNLGLRHAAGEIVAFPDDDCWYEPDVVATILSRLDQDHSVDGVVAQWVEQAAASPARPTTGVLSLVAWRRFRDGDASAISLFLKTEAVTRLGGFDTAFGLDRWFGGGEETDLLLRVLADGARLVRSPESRVHHHFGSPGAADLKADCRRARTRARGTGGIYAKHGLEPWVIARGLAAPIVKPLAGGNLRSALKGACVALGRLEGYLAWKAGKAT